MYGTIKLSKKEEALHVDAIEMIGMNEWIWNFLKEQGFDFMDNTFHINRLDVK